MFTETFSKWIVVNLELGNLQMKGTRLSITVTGWGLHYSKTFTSVFITTYKLCEGFGHGHVSLTWYLSSPSSPHH